MKGSENKPTQTISDPLRENDRSDSCLSVRYQHNPMRLMTIRNRQHQQELIGCRYMSLLQKGKTYVRNPRNPFYTAARTLCNPRTGFGVTPN